MWDETHCISAQSRVAELAPAIDQFVAGLRRHGTLVIHAPSESTDYYSNSPARIRAQAAPYVDAKQEFNWNWPDPAREPPLPGLITDPDGCSCDSGQPCGPPYHGSRQIESIRVETEDALTDDGQEVYNLLADRQIEHVLLVGVHANICVLSRPFGIRQLVYLGKKPILCRDLTDSFYRYRSRDPAGHAQILAHIERHWCPTITSDQLVGGRPFSFSNVRDPRARG